MALLLGKSEPLHPYSHSNNLLGILTVNMFVSEGCWDKGVAAVIHRAAVPGTNTAKTEVE